MDLTSPPKKSFLRLLAEHATDGDRVTLTYLSRSASLSVCLCYFFSCVGWVGREKGVWGWHRCVQIVVVVVVVVVVGVMEPLAAHLS